MTSRRSIIVTAVAACLALGVLLGPGIRALVVDSDTEETLFGDAVSRTEFRLRTIARGVSRHDSAYGRLPAAIDGSELILPTFQPRERFVLDAWNRTIEYTPSDSGFALRSAGADGRWHSSDDIVVSVPRYATQRTTYDP